MGMKRERQARRGPAAPSRGLSLSGCGDRAESETLSCAVGVSSFSPAALSQAPQEAANSALASSSIRTKALNGPGPFWTPLAPKPLIAGRIAAGLVDRTETDIAAVELEMIGAVAGFVAEPWSVLKISGLS